MSEESKPPVNLKPLTAVFDRALLGDEECKGIAAVFDDRLHDIKQSVDRIGLGDSHGKGAIEQLAISVDGAGESIGGGLREIAAAIHEFTETFKSAA